MQTIDTNLPIDAARALATILDADERADLARRLWAAALSLAEAAEDDRSLEADADRAADLASALGWLDN